MKKSISKKRKMTLVFLVLCVTFLFANFFCAKSSFGRPIIVKASAEKDAEEELNKTIEEQIGALDLDALQKYVNDLGSFTNESVAERLIDYIKGEKFDYTGFGKQILNVLLEKVAQLTPSFACIIAITLLSGLISTLKGGSGGNTASEMIFLISYVAALIPLLVVLTECFQTSIGCISSMQKQMQIVFPLMLTLMSASGGTLSAAICRPAVAFFSVNIVSVISSVVFPITIAIIVFSLAGNLTKELKIGKFTMFFKSINKWLIGISVSVFGLFFTLQGITSASYDGVVRRAAKYAIGNGVPIIGGFLSGGFDLAVAGSVLIKNSLGSMGIFLMVFILFEPLILLIAVNVLLRLTSAITQPFGDSRISDFLGETADNLQFCTAGLLFTAFLYFITIIVMVGSSEALF